MTTRRPAGLNLSFLAGLYTRVARQTGVHPSYVSRVARGERRSDRVSRAISSELAQFVPEQGSTSRSSAAAVPSVADYRHRLVRRLKANPHLAKLGVMVLDLGETAISGRVSRVSRVNLQSRIAASAPMIAATVEHFERMSRKLRNSPHVLSLTDGEGVVLYSFGSTELVEKQGRMPGANWSNDHGGPSVEPRAIAAGVPVIIVGTPDASDALLPVRMACPIRLGDGHVAGVVVLSIDLSPARAEHLVEMAKMAKKICRVVEDERKKPSRMHARSQVQPFEEAEVHLARVMSMPQIGSNTRAHLATVLAELEEKRREVLLHSADSKTSRKGNARAQSV